MDIREHILSGENLTSIYLANMSLIYLSVVHPVGGQGMWWRWMGGIIILASLEYHFYQSKPPLSISFCRLRKRSLLWARTWTTWRTRLTSWHRMRRTWSPRSGTENNSEMTSSLIFIILRLVQRILIVIYRIDL